MAMAHFVCLVTYTKQGLQQLGATTKRAQAFQKMAESMGAKVNNTLWTLGAYDLVMIMEAPDEKTAAKVAFSLNSLGNVRTHTLTAFTSEEMSDDILEGVRTGYDLLRVEQKALGAHH
jgi:uncharacterized protein with GYD domain